MKTTLKRIAAPRTWPIMRKANKWIMRPRPKGQPMALTLPIVVALRDMLGLVETAKQARAAMREHEIKVNGKRIFQDDRAVGFMDVLSVDKDNYICTINKKGILTMESQKASDMVQKITGKKHVRGGKMQLQFLSGMNVLVDKDTYKVGDSVTLNDGKISGHHAYKKGASVMVIGGTHIGARGKIDSVSDDSCTVKTDKATFPTTKDNVYVTA